MKNILVAFHVILRIKAPRPELLPEDMSLEKNHRIAIGQETTVTAGIHLPDCLQRGSLDTHYLCAGLDVFVADSILRAVGSVIRQAEFAVQHTLKFTCLFSVVFTA